MSRSARIAGVSHWVSPDVVSITEASERVGRSPEWIRTRLGVESRHRFRGLPDEQGALAARPLLEAHGPPDLVLSAAATPRQLLPDTAVFIARELGLSGIPAYSMHATCLSFLVGLRHAMMLVEHGVHDRVLIVSSEIASHSLDPSEPESAALIGDGAAAAMVVAAPDGPATTLRAFVHRTWPEGADLTEYRGAGVRCPPGDPTTTDSDNRFHMRGPAIYRMARKKVAAVLDEVEALTGVAPGDVDLLVPHQASGNALASLSRYGFREDRVVDVVARFGNCIAASIPMALSVALEEGRITRGDTVLLLGTGAGLSVGAALLRW